MKNGMRKGLVLGLALFLLVGLLQTAEAWGPMMRGITPERGCLVAELSEDERDKFAELRESFASETEEIREALTSKREELRELWRQEEPEKEALLSAGEEQLTLRLALREKWNEFRAEMEELLPSETWEAVEDRLEGVRGRMHHVHRGRDVEDGFRRSERRREN